MQDSRVWAGALAPANRWTRPRTIADRPRSGQSRRLPLAAALLALSPWPGHAGSAGFVLPEPALPLPAPVAAAAARLDATVLREHVDWLADPRREGRGLGSAGYDAAAEYVAARLARAGLRPAGDRGFFQHVPLRRITRPAGGVEIGGPGGGTLRWRAGRDCVVPQVAPQALAAPVVFAGHAIREPALGHDDFAGLDVAGKVVVFRSGVPGGAAWQTPELLERYAGRRAADRYDARLDELRARGARAAVALEAGLAARLARGEERPEPVYFVAAATAPQPLYPPLWRADADTARAWLAGLPATAAGARAELEVTGEVREDASRNVLGLLPGADGGTSAGVVVIGAHLDHLGIEAGVLHPGADDNASGVSAVLEIAGALAAGDWRPARGILFAFWTGEESGHYGSVHYARHPAVPLADTLAYVNLDTIAHYQGAGEIADLARRLDPQGAPRLLGAVEPGRFTDPGFAADSPWLADILARGARGTGMALYMEPVDGRLGGSDYRVFARAGLPWIRFFGAFSPGYHQPGDTPDTVDPQRVLRMARLALATTALLADRQEDATAGSAPSR